ncbi:right-handed parallel beta-helix repeat-containing protein, partial [Bartonella bovis]|uniref:right-handed parallel beta-helix repeat-containing protein n=1 Tax=Bartonella bovis TaxID=155194 RepID=UPI001304C95C
IEGGGGSGTGLSVQNGTGTLTSVDISKFGKGVDVQGGTLKMMEGTVTFEGSGHGVKVSGEATGTLTKVKIAGGGSGSTGTGVVMESSKTMTMTEVGISKVKVGVDVQRGTLDINMGEITFESGDGNYGVKVQNGATANLMRATIKGTNGQGTGLYVMGTGSASMMGGTISNVESGVYATGAKAVTINGTTITVKGGAESYGVKVMGTGSANLDRVTITGEGGQGKGVIMGGTGEMKMTEVDISKVKVGIQVTSGNLTVNGGTMTGVQTGITMSGSGRLTVSGGTITFKGEHGVRVGSGVTSATLTNVTIMGSGQGKGVIMESTGTMTMDGGEIKNVEKAVLMNGAGKLTINGGAKIQFTGSGYGVKVGDRVPMASLTDVTIRGEGSGAGSKGVIMESSGTMTMTKVDISNVEKAVLMKEAGTLRMDNVQISGVKMGVEAMGGNLTISGNSTIQFKNGAGNYGVKVGELVTMASLTNVAIRGEGSGTGVYVENGAGVGATGTLNMDDVHILNVGTGVWVQRGTVTINKGEITFKGAGNGKGLSIEGTATATITGTTIRG